MTSGAKRQGSKRLWGEKTRGGGGLGAKRPRFLLPTALWGPDLSFHVNKISRSDLESR